MPGFIVNGHGQGAPSTVRPYYTYTWEVQQFYGIGIGATPPPERLPLIYLRDAGVPTWDFDREEVMGANMVYKFAKSIKWNDIKFVWYDTVGLASIVKEWRDAIWTADTGLANPDDYKRQSVLRSLDFSWANPIIWTMHNSWPCAVKVDNLTYTQSDVKAVEVTLAYDWAVDQAPAGRTLRTDPGRRELRTF